MAGPEKVYDLPVAETWTRGSTLLSRVYDLPVSETWTRGATLLSRVYDLPATVTWEASPFVRISDLALLLDWELPAAGGATYPGYLQGDWIQASPRLQGSWVEAQLWPRRRS